MQLVKSPFGNTRFKPIHVNLLPPFEMGDSAPKDAKSLDKKIPFFGQATDGMHFPKFPLKKRLLSRLARRDLAIVYLTTFVFIYVEGGGCILHFDGKMGKLVVRLRNVGRKRAQIIGRGFAK